MKPYFDSKGKRFIRFPFFFLFGALIAWSCSDSPQHGRVIASVDDQILTMEMVQSLANPDQTLTNAEVHQIVNRWVTSEMLYQEARRRGYDASESIQQKVADARKQLSIAELLEQEVYSLAENSVSSQEIAQYFKDHTDDYVLKEDMVRLSIAIFNQNENATQFRASALSTIGWNKSISELRGDGTRGLLSFSDSVFFLQSALYPPELWKVASILGMEEVSFPIKTSIGYVVMQSLGQFKQGTIKPLSSVDGEIRNRLAMERRQELYQNFIQQLRNKHSVQLMISSTDSTSSGGE